MKPGAQEGAVDSREKISNSDPSTRSKSESREKTQTPPESSSNAEECEKSRKVRSKRHSDHNDSFDETVFEKLTTPVRPAVVTMPTRWATKHQKEIERIRKKYKRSKSYRSKMTLSDLSFMSHFELEDQQEFKKGRSKNSSPTQSSLTSVRSVRSDKKSKHGKPEVLVDSIEQRMMDKEQCKTIEVEPEPKSSAPNKVREKEEEPQSECPSACYFTAPTSQPSSDLSDTSTRSRKLHKVKYKVKDGMKEILPFPSNRNDEKLYKSEHKPKIAEKEPQQPSTSVYTTAYDNVAHSPQRKSSSSSPMIPSPRAHHHSPSHRKHSSCVAKKKHSE